MGDLERQVARLPEKESQVEELRERLSLEKDEFQVSLDGMRDELAGHREAIQ